MIIKIDREFEQRCPKLRDEEFKRLIWEYVHPTGVRKVYGREPIQPDYFQGGAR